jgi:hypothetical protein
VSPIEKSTDLQQMLNSSDSRSPVSAASWITSGKYLELVLEIADLKERLKMKDVLGATWIEDGLVCIDQSLEGKEGRFAFTVAHDRILAQAERQGILLDGLGKDLTPGV